MASNLTSQVRAISTVTQAIANGDMSQKIDVEAKGEILVLKETINNMVDRLSIFCNEVQRVAKDVGVDGIMGGQADVAGLKGRWKEITADVNTMANNLASPPNTSSLPLSLASLTRMTYRPPKCAPLGTLPMRPRMATLPSWLKWKPRVKWTN